MKADAIHAMIIELSQRRDDLQREYKKVLEAINTIRGICDHDWSYEGHGHNTDYFRCDICGLEKEE